MDSEEIKETGINFKQFFGKDGNPMPVYQYKGYNILYLEMAATALPKLKTVKIRSDDILMYSYPGAVPYADCFKHTVEFYEFMKNNPNVLIITYEEIKNDQFKAVSRVANFLEKPISDQLTKSIIDMCSFDKMKSEKPLVRSYIPKDFFKEGGTLYHSGTYITPYILISIISNIHTSSL
ncbi:luciferin sulfotransferase-like [Octopus bimaculoides]|uniref:luciferin sulfotransferase-like n=1 Tax=Octopus bimaculoides TaxID=37653 RepID=UPI0022E70CAD|nr:luciferin sulfotransferase-like [Octopus bimaculoides]